MAQTRETTEIRMEDLAGPGGLAGIWPRSRPVEIEIGCGKGRFAIRNAEAMPHVNFLAIERANRYFKIAVSRADRRGLANLRLVRADALELLQGHVPAASVQAVHVLFPDPWPKKRHHKRRLFQAAFIEAVAAGLVAGGHLNVATDFTDYFHVIAELLDRTAALRREEGFALAGRLPSGELGHTNYEVKYRAAGRQIHQATWSRRPRRST